VRVNVNDVAVRLPDIAVLRDRCRALAMIEAIVSPRWEYRYYFFDAAWSPGAETASMTNGQGDAYSIVFSPPGAFIRGFDHESPMSPASTGDLWPGLIDTVPADFDAQINEPAFSYDGRLDATFVLWRQASDDRWRTGTIEFPPYGGYRASPDGAEMLTILCDPSPDTYLSFAADYYETALDPAAVGHVWALRPLDDAIVAALNPDLALADLQHDIEVIGYPTAAPPNTGGG
jgi:hypothetical protein